MMRIYTFVTALLCSFFPLWLLDPTLGFAKTHYVKTSSDLRSTLKQAQPGDEIIVANGTYEGAFDIKSNSGTSANPIVLRAENRHRAILKGVNKHEDYDRNFHVTKSWWIIDGFKMTESCRGIDIDGGGHLEIRNNLIHDFLCDGVYVRGSNANYIHENVIAFSPISDRKSEAGIRILYDSDGTIIENNIVYSMSDDGHQSGSKHGYSIIVAHEVDDTLIRGNLVMDGAKGSIRIFSEWGRPQLKNNIIQDNIIAFNGDGLNFLHAGSNYTTITNNIIYGCRHTAFNGKGNSPGNNRITHNTVFLTELSRHGGLWNTDKGVASENTTVKDNIFYAPYSSSSSSKNKFLYVGTNFKTAIKEMNYNLFWRPGSSDNWSTTNVKHGLNDIHDPGRKPIFVDEAGGDFTLANGSPGKGKASDGTDIGAIFNGYLKRRWMRNILALPTEKKVTNGTSISISTSSTHQYQVYAYLPEDNPYKGTETFVIEGKKISRDLRKIIDDQYVGAAPQRWVYLGTHPNDGTLNIQWTHSNAAKAMSIRQLPTATEAYGWLSGTVAPARPPINLRIVDGNS